MKKVTRLDEKVHLVGLVITFELQPSRADRKILPLKMNVSLEELQWQVVHASASWPQFCDVLPSLTMVNMW